MQDKESGINFFKELKQIAQAPYKMAVGIFRLAYLEMQLAKKSLLIMIFLFSSLMIVCITFWFGINILLFVHLQLLGISLTNALLIIIGSNILLAIIFLAFFVRFARLTTFSETRQQLISFTK